MLGRSLSGIRPGSYTVVACSGTIPGPGGTSVNRADKLGPCERMQLRSMMLQVEYIGARTDPTVVHGQSMGETHVKAAQH